MKTKIFSKYVKAIFESITYSKRNFSLYSMLEIFDWFQSIFTIVIVSYIIVALETKNLESLYFWVWIFIFIGILKLFNSLFTDSLYSSTFNDVEFWLSRKYLHSYIQLDNTKIEEYGTGKMNNIIFSWINSISEILRLSVAIFVELIAIIYIFIIVLTKVPNFYYFSWFIFSFFLVIYLFWKGLAQIWKIRKVSKELDIEMDHKKIKILMSKFEILQNNKIDYEIKEIHTIYWKYKKLWWYGNLKKNFWQTWSEITLQGFHIIIFLVIWVWIIKWNYDISTFALLIWLLKTLSQYAWQIRWYMRDILSNFINIEKLIDTFEKIPKQKDDSLLPNFNFNNWDIKLENVSFWYNEENLVLTNFDLDLKWWKKYAFVWKSWWWKSTIIKLLAWYILPNTWNIIIDWQKLSEVNLKSYYQYIGYLSQEPSVFDGTIIENLLYALDYVPDNKKLKEVIKLSKCEFIFDLKDWLETEIWERWIKLSWWQKQRLAIAKVMLKNPQIILLDEPTSALDSFNEEEVSIAFKNLFENKTVIIVAHRLQTVKNSDMIFFIENWKIIEEWNHNELLKMEWNYYKMIELQSWF
jgi:ABC-type multidrug transport system fused ATPase/permease subunit